jgi:hypothetical protein
MLKYQLIEIRGVLSLSSYSTYKTKSKDFRLKDLQ